MCHFHFWFFFQISIESFTKVSFFLHTCIGVSVLLLLSNCRVATSLFHHEDGVCYQDEYFYIIVQVYCCCFLTVEMRRVRFIMKAESVTKVSIFYIMVQVYCCCFLTVELRRVCFTMKAESITKVSIFYIMVQVYCYCFLTVELRRVCFTMKAESVTKVVVFHNIELTQQIFITELG